MPNGWHVTGALVAGLALGAWLTPADVPDTKVISVPSAPKVYTHKETTTRLIPAESPEACKSLSLHSQEVVDAVNDLQTTGTALLDAVQGIEYARDADHDALYKLQTDLAQSLKDNQTALYEAFVSLTTIDALQTSCEEATKGGD